MGAKRYAALLLGLALALSLLGCGAIKDKEKDKGADGAMSIQPAQLSEEEQALLQLLAVGMDNYRIFDFQLKEGSGVQSVILTTHELLDGDWSAISQDRISLTDAEGRIALTFRKITDGATMAVQSASGGRSNSYAPVPEEDVSNMAFATSKLSSPTPIEFDQEIPLVLQVATAKSEFTTYDVAYFGMPRELAKHEYEHVYAITATFSQKPVSEPPQGAPAPSPQPSPVG